MDLLRKLQEEANKKAKDGGLTSIQRDEVRALLGKYVRPAKRNTTQRLVPDPLRGVPPGSLISMERCNAGDAWQHRVIREARMCIYPYLVDDIHCNLEEFIVEVQQCLGGEISIEGDTVVVKLEQGRPVAAIRIVVRNNAVESVNFEVA